MAVLTYRSSISGAWGPARQERALTGIAPGAVSFLDMAKGDRTQRAAMFGAARRGDIIHVASLAVLSDDESDLLELLGFLAEPSRGLQMVAAECGTVIQPGSSRDTVVSAWKRARRLARARFAGEAGGAATRKLAMARTSDGAERIRSRWCDPRHETAALLREAGISRNTAQRELGLRSAAIAAEFARLKRLAGEPDA